MQWQVHGIYEYLITRRHFGTFLKQNLHKLKVTVADGFQQRCVTILHVHSTADLIYSNILYPLDIKMGPNSDVFFPAHRLAWYWRH